jgi:hypothetical protein
MPRTTSRAVHGYGGRGLTYCGLIAARDGRAVVSHGNVTCKRCARAIKARQAKR